MPSNIVKVDKPVGRPVVPLPKKYIEKMYLPIAVETALIEICEANRSTTRDFGASESSNLLSEIALYHAFLNKIAQACDNKKSGGDTITSATIKQTPEGPVFLLAFNHQSPEEAEDTAKFLKRLLSLLEPSPSRLAPKALQKRVLWRILQHHVNRLEHYLAGLADSVNKCVDYCLRHGESDAIRELRRLQARAEFPRDIWTSEGTRNKFLRDCETLIKAIVAAKNTELERIVESKSKQGQVTESPCWCDLGHFMGRLQSYQQAAKLITDAVTRWPSLFVSSSIQLVPSSEPSRRPLSGLQMTPNEVMERVLGDYDLECFNDGIARFNKMGLGNAIQKQLTSQKFRPYVHCEVLLHSYLLDSNLNHESDFFNGWKVIGSSKPLCRLCHYYFTNHPDNIRVRSPHPNLYRCWCLPDVYVDQGTRAVKARIKMVNCIIRSVTQDAVKTLLDRLARRKPHDSNTFTSIPGQLDLDSDSDFDSDIDDDGETKSYSSNFSMRLSSSTVQPTAVCSTTDWDVDSEGGVYLGINLEEYQS